MDKKLNKINSQIKPSVNNELVSILNNDGQSFFSQRTDQRTKHCI